MNNGQVEARHREMGENIEKLMKGKYGNDIKNPQEGYKYVAVGYLDITEKQYEVGDVPDGFVKKLECLYNRGGVIATMGHHECEFCINQGVKKLPRDALSSTEKTLTDKENKIIYIFPEMIFHYIKVHTFKPSQVFIDFVMRH